VVSEVNPTEDRRVDTHDPAGMARWLRERKQACLEFYELDDDAQRLHYLQKWQLNVLPHLAFRFGQAAEMIERLDKENRRAMAALVRNGVETMAVDPGFVPDVPAPECNCGHPIYVHASDCPCFQPPRT